MIRVTDPGLPSEDIRIREEYNGFFEYSSEPFTTASERHQYLPGVALYSYSTPRMLYVDATIKALVSDPGFAIHPGLLFGLEMRAAMTDPVDGSTIWGVYRLHNCKMREFAFGLWHVEATPVTGTDQIYRIWVEKEDS